MSDGYDFSARYPGDESHDDPEPSELLFSSEGFFLPIALCTYIALVIFWNGIIFYATDCPICSIDIS